MRDGIEIKLTGFDFLEQYQQELTSTQYMNGLKKAADSGATIMEPAVRSEAPIQHGTLRRSIDIKVKGYKRSSTAIAVIGPESKFKASEPPTGRIEQPSRIAHLIERGHRIVRGGKVVGQAKANPFTQRSLNRIGKRALNAMADSALTNLSLAAERAAKKANKTRAI